MTPNSCGSNSISDVCRRSVHHARARTELGLDVEHLVESQQRQNTQNLTSRPGKDDAPAIGLKGLVDTQQRLDSRRVHEPKTTQIEMELATVSLARGIGDCALEFPSARDVQFALH